MLWLMGLQNTICCDTLCLTSYHHYGDVRLCTLTNLTHEMSKSEMLGCVLCQFGVIGRGVLFALTKLPWASHSSVGYTG